MMKSKSNDKDLNACGNIFIKEEIELPEHDNRTCNEDSFLTFIKQEKEGEQNIVDIFIKKKNLNELFEHDGCQETKINLPDATNAIKEKSFAHQVCNELKTERKEGIERACEKCHKTFLQESDLTQHLKDHSETKSFECEQCRKSFTQKKYLFRHLKLHSAITKMFQCRQCPKSFTQKTYLARHLRCHAEKEPVRCEQCNKTFTRRNYLTVHLRYHIM